MSQHHSASHPSHAAAHANNDDEYEDLVFPRNAWPCQTYYHPRMKCSGDLRGHMLFAAQKASRKVARAFTAGRLDGIVDAHDLNMAVLDVVLEL